MKNVKRACNEFVDCLHSAHTEDDFRRVADRACIGVPLVRLFWPPREWPKSDLILSEELDQPLLSGRVRQHRSRSSGTAKYRPDVPVGWTRGAKRKVGERTPSV